jgi:predicted component of type VI protein secretion system
MELRELLAELVALEPGKDKDGFEVAPYNHDKPAIAFSELAEKLRARLRGTVVPKFLSLEFKREGPIFTAALTDEHITAPNEYFLAIQTKDDPRTVTALVEDVDRFRLMVKSVANQRIWGVKMTEERNPPLELPVRAGTCYFRLMRQESARMWERIVAEKAIAVRWSDMDTMDYSLTLYMTVPEDRKGR